MSYYHKSAAISMKKKLYCNYKKLGISPRSLVPGHLCQFTAHLVELILRPFDRRYVRARA